MKGRISKLVQRMLDDEEASRQLGEALRRGGGMVVLNGKVYRVRTKFGPRPPAPTWRDRLRAWFGKKSRGVSSVG